MVVTSATSQNPQKQRVCHSHCGLAIYIKKNLKAKQELIKNQIFHHANIWSSKTSSKRNQNPSRYYNSI